MYKDFEEAATHPSDLEEEVLLTRPLRPQNFSLCLSVCVHRITAYGDTNELPVKMRAATEGVREGGEERGFKI